MSGPGPARAAQLHAADSAAFAAAGGADPLSLVIAAAREMSRFQDPGALTRVAVAYGRKFLGFNRSLMATRRELSPPDVRLMRSPLLPDTIDPWRQQHLLPVLHGGVLAALLYEGQPRVIEELVVPDDDPARPHLAGMRSLVAIPLYQDGGAVDMVYHLRRQPAAFSRERLAEMVLLSNLFGQSVWGAARARESAEHEADAKNQYQIVTELANNALSSALDLKDDNEVLEQRVRVRTAELREAHLDTIYMLAIASEAKDEDTGQHVRRIERLTRSVAAELGLAEKESEAMGLASILHDVGKIHVPDQILKKPGQLTVEERAAMQEHTLAGERILGENPYFAPARRIARSHHENFDGSGYPDRTSGSEIPIEARIVHIADVYDALVNPRVYKPAWTQRQALDFIRDARGKMFDPEVVRAFESVQG
jgi:HD-GYP domain-containing protein (c-di-GMP phosphodiesterase class II)